MRKYEVKAKNTDEVFVFQSEIGFLQSYLEESLVNGTVKAAIELQNSNIELVGLSQSPKLRICVSIW